MWKHPYEAVVLFQHVIASEIRFAFSRSVWKGLKAALGGYMSTEHQVIAWSSEIGIANFQIGAFSPEKLLKLHFMTQ